MTSAVGAGRAAHREAMLALRTGVRQNDWQTCPLDTWIGRVHGVESVRLPEALHALTCRNNQLAWLAAQQNGFADAVSGLRERYSPHRIGVFLGTSTGGVEHTEQAIAQQLGHAKVAPTHTQPAPHSPHTTAQFLADAFGLTGPCHTVSTACSSSATVFADASRMIALGLIDAALVGGVDSLSRSTLYGFKSLQLLSAGLCKPLDTKRDGINVGEAAGFALLQRGDHAENERPRLSGYGMSSDAHHISAPPPDGNGARRALGAAIDMANRAITAPVGLMVLHGTGTPQNDAAEAAAVNAVLPAGTPACSVKGWTGHTLGAAGVINLAYGLLAAEDSTIPATLNLETLDPTLDLAALPSNRRAPIARFVCNAFGFGGSNTVLVVDMPGTTAWAAA